MFGKWIVAIIAILVVGFFVARRVVHRTIRLSADQIQAELVHKFPFEKKDLLYTVVFSNPLVKMDPQSNQISLGVTTAVKVLGANAISGQSQATGTIRYETDNGELFMDSPRANVSGFNIAGIPERYQKVVGDALGLGLTETLKRSPIYRLEEKDAKSFIGRRVLKSVRIENGLLVVELGM